MILNDSNLFFFTLPSYVHLIPMILNLLAFSQLWFTLLDSDIIYSNWIDSTSLLLTQIDNAWLKLTLFNQYKLCSTLINSTHLFLLCWTLPNYIKLFDFIWLCLNISKTVVLCSISEVYFTLLQLNQWFLQNTQVITGHL